MKLAIACITVITAMAGCATQSKLAPGTFFADLTGHLKQDATNHNAVFTFDPESPSRPPLTFAVEPSAKLTLMQSAEAQAGGALHFRVTAQITPFNTLEILRVTIVEPS
jgi:hypothetical protein